jgi:hypothetical protein
MRLSGHIGKQQVLILIDSGSSGNFISQELVQALHLPVQTAPPVQVTIADGKQLLSDAGLPNWQWGVQQTKFTTPVRVLPLKCYDMILGMDWLETCNGGKMFVDWARKKMRFLHDGKRITLRGINANNNFCPAISSMELNQLVQQGAVAQLIALDISKDTHSLEVITESINQILQAHTQVFSEPTEVPPSRPFDHAIPLIPGAVPIQKKPYRYAPSQKD